MPATRSSSGNTTPHHHDYIQPLDHTHIKSNPPLHHPCSYHCSITKVPILVARYAGSPHMLARVEEGVRMFQTNEEVT